MTATSKKAIIKEWLQPDPPTGADKRGLGEEIRVMESITFDLNLRAHVFAGYWERWVLYVGLR